MLNAKHPVIKIGGYVIIGFFTLIVIISFGMPDFMSRMGKDENTVAVVNGEQIHRLDYLRYRDRFSQYLKEGNSKQMEPLILDRMIMQRLLLQKANKLGIRVSQERVQNGIKDIPFLKNEGGKFDGSRLERYLDYTHQNLADFYKGFEEELIIEEMRTLIETSVGISPDEVQFEYTMDNSKIRIKYCFLSNKEMRKRFGGRLTVSDQEIDSDLKNNKDEAKDPKTDRNRIKMKLENNKFNDVKNEIMRKIDALAKEKKGFEQAASILAGEIGISDDFKIGGQLKKNGKEERPLYSLSNSPVFNQELLSIEKGITSKAIEGFDGIYIFTPVKKEMISKMPAAEASEKLAGRLKQEESDAIFMTLLTSLRDSSKITKNLKFN